MKKTGICLLSLVTPFFVFAGEADLKIPEAIHSNPILYWGFLVTLSGLAFGLYHYLKIKRLPAHKSMLEIAEVIFQTAG